ncbi:UNVERIFIED_CONTAM: hypothetical protein FKN15_073452 [Acipenser sinensis]
MKADVGQRLIFPSEITTTNLRPDIVFWSGSAHLVHLVELTVPWEDAVDEAYERKKLRYAQLAAEAEKARMESPGLPSGGGLSRICGTLYNLVSQRCWVQWSRVASHSEELI